MQRTDFEIVVIGAGPAGSYAARCLAERGHEVALIDENDGPRCPVICSGIVGREAFEALPLPEHTIVDTIRSARFISPTGNAVSYAPARPLAYVVDRTRFDGALAGDAVQAGALLLQGARAREIRRSATGVTICLEDRGEVQGPLHSRAVIIATGHQRPFHAALGLGSPERYVHGIHAELPFTAVEEAELYFGTAISPGFFAWVVPFGNDRARLGILSERNGHDLFDQFSRQQPIKSRVHAGFQGLEDSTVRSRGIVQGLVRPSFSDRTLAVGEAAGQIKTTTSGGIYYGMIGAGIAAEVLSGSLRRNRLDATHLRHYEQAWRERLGEEIHSGLALQRLGREMDDQAIEHLFVGLQNGLGTAIREVVRFDWHRPAVGLLFRHPKAGLYLMKRILKEGV